VYIKSISSMILSSFLLISSAQAMTVNFNPPLTVGSVERFTIDDSGTDVTANYTIQSIAPDPVSGYTPAKGATAFRANQPGSFAITFVSNVDSSTFTSSASYTVAPAYVQLSSGSLQSATTGAPLAQPIKVIVTDASGNNLSGVTVTWSITGSGGIFSGPSVTDSTGIAATTLTMGSTPGTYSVSATAGSVTTSDKIQATANPAASQLANLGMSTQPSNQNEQGIAFPTQPVLSLTTGSAAAYTTPTTVTASAFINNGCTTPASTPLSGTLSVQSDAAGKATFTNLSYPNQTSFFIKFTAGSLSICSSSLVVSPPASTATIISLVNAPSSTYTNYQFNFIVNVTDSSSNLIASASNPISLAAFTDASCSSAATGTLANSGTVSAYRGQALFNALTYSNNETIYIKASSAGLTPLCSAAIVVNKNPLDIPTSLAFLSVPTSELITNSSFSVQPFAYIKNGAGTMYQGPTNFPITITAYSDSTCSTAAPGVLSGVTNLQSSAGSASFAGLGYPQVGNIYLGISAPGLTKGCSSLVAMTSNNPCLASEHYDSTSLACYPNTLDCTSSILNSLSSTQTWNPGTLTYDTCKVQSCSTNFTITSNSCSFTAAGVSVAISGNGSVVGSPSSGSGSISCPSLSSCSSVFAQASTVSLVATPAYGNIFTGWDQSCSSFGTSNCSLYMNGSSFLATALFTGKFNQQKGFNGSVTAIAKQSDGKYIVGGSFTSLNGVAVGGIARLTSAGILDTTFNVGGSGFTGSINAIAIDSSGNIYVGGLFGGYNGFGSNAQNIIKLNSNGAKIALNTSDVSGTTTNGVNGAVNALAFDSSGNLWVGGAFTQSNIGGTGAANNANRILKISPTGSVIKLNSGDLNLAYGNGVDNEVRAITFASNKIWIGGRFHNCYVGGATSSANAGLDNAMLITTLSLTDGTCKKINPTDANGSAGNGIYYFSYNPSNFVNAIKVDSQGNVYAGGTFSSTSIGGTTKIVDNIVKINSSGAVVKINPSDIFSEAQNGVGGYTTGSVNSIAIDSSDNVYIGGFSINSAHMGNPTSAISLPTNIGKISSTGSLTSVSGSGNYVQGYSSILLLADGSMLVGSTTGLAKVTAANLPDPAFNMGRAFSGTIYSTTIQSDGKIVVGGSFSSYNTTPAQNLARLNADGTLDLTFNAGGIGPNSSVYALTQDSSGHIWMGGSFNLYNGIYTNYIAELTSSGSRMTIGNDNLTIYGNGVNTTVKTVAIDPSGNIWLGGLFTQSYFGGSGTANNANYIAKISPAGIRIPISTGDGIGSASNGFNSSVYSIAFDTLGNTYVGGNFQISYIGGSGTLYNANYIAKIYNGSRVPINLADNVANNGNGVNAIVYTLLTDSADNLYAGGSFNSAYTGNLTTTAPNNANFILKLNSSGAITKINPTLDVNGSATNGFRLNTGPTGYVDSLMLDASSNLWVGGYFNFSGVGGVNSATNNIAKISSSGAKVAINASDTTSINGFDNVVRSIVLDSSGRIVVGGDMTAYRTTTLSGAIFRLNPDGTDVN
jgi:uncharacterized delta-60 repeat protein